MKYNTIITGIMLLVVCASSALAADNKSIYQKIYSSGDKNSKNDSRSYTDKRAKQKKSGSSYKAKKKKMRKSGSRKVHSSAKKRYSKKKYVPKRSTYRKMNSNKKSPVVKTGKPAKGTNQKSNSTYSRTTSTPTLRQKVTTTGIKRSTLIKNGRNNSLMSNSPLSTSKRTGSSDVSIGTFPVQRKRNMNPAQRRGYAGMLDRGSNSSNPKGIPKTDPKAGSRGSYGRDNPPKVTSSGGSTFYSYPDGSVVEVDNKAGVKKSSAPPKDSEQKSKTDGNNTEPIANKNEKKNQESDNDDSKGSGSKSYTTGGGNGQNDHLARRDQAIKDAGKKAYEECKRREAARGGNTTMPNQSSGGCNTNVSRGTGGRGSTTSRPSDQANKQSLSGTRSPTARTGWNRTPDRERVQRSMEGRSVPSSSAGRAPVVDPQEN